MSTFRPRQPLVQDGTFSFFLFTSFVRLYSSEFDVRVLWTSHYSRFTTFSVEFVNNEVFWYLFVPFFTVLVNIVPRPFISFPTSSVCLRLNSFFIEFLRSFRNTVKINRYRVLIYDTVVLDQETFLFTLRFKLHFNVSFFSLLRLFI